MKKLLLIFTIFFSTQSINSGILSEKFNVCKNTQSFIKELYESKIFQDALRSLILVENGIFDKAKSTKKKIIKCYNQISSNQKIQFDEKKLLIGNYIQILIILSEIIDKIGGEKKSYLYPPFPINFYDKKQNKVEIKQQNHLILNHQNQV